MRKWLWGGGIVAVVIIAGWGALRLLQADIGMTLFERQAKEIVGTDASAALENGLHVYLCGTGSPLPDPSRAGPCLGILAGQSAFIFDTGSGSMRKLARMGFPMGQTKAAFLTHLHSDHIDGLGEMMLQAWIVGSRSTPLPIYGPVGTQQVSGSFVSAYQIDSQYRVAHHGEKVANPQGFGLAAEEIEFEEGRRQKVVYEAGGVTITAFLVNHEPVEPALGYRVDYAGRSVTISGDTIKDDTVILMARDTDLLVHEALNRDMVLLMADAAKNNGNSSLSKIFSDILDYHASPAEAAEVAESAGAGMLVLTHIVPPLPSRFLYPAFLGEAPDRFSGDVVVGEDGMMVSLPANKQTQSLRQLLN
ncbi:MBL fold metallo-hydrolase [Henriciella mobilis]|uniref:MBL fold metallo-hydrolase n=1 Tax=Henriciella mobilis TaxID=2305467 RepID=A0A399RA78_9PROT|nr:MBL fold metallo-hydrolase [Henriciella mobilis]RIJ26925.1 MBL fold metallo-hydrolase [Henriciella mobilis]